MSKDPLSDNETNDHSKRALLQPKHEKIPSFSDQSILSDLSINKNNEDDRDKIGNLKKFMDKKPMKGHHHRHSIDNWTMRISLNINEQIRNDLTMPTMTKMSIVCNANNSQNPFMAEPELQSERMNDVELWNVQKIKDEDIEDMLKWNDFHQKDKNEKKKL